MDYTSIIAEVTQRTGYSDVAIRAAQFTQRAEADINRMLRVGDMERTVARVLDAAGEAKLPDDFLHMRSVTVSGVEFPQIALVDVQQRASCGWAIRSRQIVSTEGGGTMNMTYYAKIDPLAESGTNWLSEASPETYIYGIMAKVYGFNADLEKTIASNQMFLQSLDSIRYADATGRILGAPARINGAVV